MDIWEMRREISRANSTIRAADQMASDIAQMFPGRLRHVSPSVLAKLKAELRDFNIHTSIWKNT